MKTDGVVRRALLLCVMFLTLWLPTAGAESFEIDAYTVSIQVSDRAELEVEEVIDVRFLEPRHGIFRLIPFKYKTDSLAGTFRAKIGRAHV